MRVTGEDKATLLTALRKLYDSYDDQAEQGEINATECALFKQPVARLINRIGRLRPQD